MINNTQKSSVHIIDFVNMNLTKCMILSKFKLENLLMTLSYIFYGTLSGKIFIPISFSTYNIMYTDITMYLDNEDS
jgi:hypothetical protein